VLFVRYPVDLQHTTYVNNSRGTDGPLGRVVLSRIYITFLIWPFQAAVVDSVICHTYTPHIFRDSNKYSCHYRILLKKNSGPSRLPIRSRRALYLAARGSTVVRGGACIAQLDDYRVTQEHNQDGAVANGASQQTQPWKIEFRGSGIEYTQL